MEIQIIEITHKLEESIKLNMELSSHKSKLQSENSNLLSQLEEAESHINGFAKSKQQLQSQLEEARRLIEEESRLKNSLSQKLRNINYLSPLYIKMKRKPIITKINKIIELYK